MPYTLSTMSGLKTNKETDMESIYVKAKHFGSVFVDMDKDENDKDEVRLSLHILGASCRVLMTKAQAQELVEALQNTIRQDDQVV